MIYVLFDVKKSAHGGEPNTKYGFSMWMRRLARTRSWILVKSQRTQVSSALKSNDMPPSMFSSVSLCSGGHKKRIIHPNDFGTYGGIVASAHQEDFLISCASCYVVLSNIPMFIIILHVPRGELCEPQVVRLRN